MRLLIIEDDKELCDTLVYQLRQEGYEVDFCCRGDEADYYFKQGAYDAIILDRMLPEVDGLTLLEKIREDGIATPVIMVTAMNGINDRIDGLDAGADDYLIKPFAMEELLARIRALLRRPGKMVDTDFVTLGSLRLDIRLHTLQNEEKEVSLSKKETLLLEFFMQNKNQVLSRNQILSKVWGTDNFVEEGNIDNYIYFVRRRLSAVKSSAKIKTIHGVGYQMEME
ncbi:response regulator transcription factor [Konateibacter massiliensis]|uniref:response regulator transcription factor n=1 Tax=Konateibacter massiliensis TaxID=2002841 RepID=UPI000C15D257|nr:response regulator transcription factor [Konateibacter massiliensis]